MMVVVPVILVAIIPVVFLVAISLLDYPVGAVMPEGILRVLPDRIAELEYRPAMFSAFTSLICPMLFLSVPIVCSLTAASSSFLEERDAGTMETLMLSACDNHSIFNAKVMGGTFISVVVSLAGFLLFAIIMSLGDIILAVPFFFNLEWFIMLVLLMPGLSMLGVLFISLLSPRITKVSEGMQMIGYFLFPIIVVTLLQFAGIAKVSLLVLFTISLVIIILDIVLFNVAARKFTPENMLTGTFLRKKAITNSNK